MKVVNQYKNIKIEKDLEGCGDLILGNDRGDYLYLAGEETRYQGFFFSDSSGDRPNVYKIIDEIRITDKRETVEVKNNFFKLERKDDNGLIESYFIPDGHNSLCLKVSRQSGAEVVLDIREPYDSRQMGRFYETEARDGIMIVRFIKRRDWSEDNLGGKKEFGVFMAIKTDKESFESVKEFFSKYYPKDHRRNSQPWDRYVFRAFRMNFKKAVFAVAKTKKEAIAEAEDVFKNFDKLYKKDRDDHSDLIVPKITDTEIKMACLCAQNSIRTLLVKGERAGAYAGIPWFFQFWHRDEAISLPQIWKIDKKCAEEIITLQLNAILRTGFFPKQRFPQSLQEVQSADVIGILARSCREIFQSGKVSKTFKQETIRKFEKIVPKLLKERTVGNLAVNFVKETWMDSIDRAGVRIEIQAGRLALYKLLFEETGNDQYKILLKDAEKETLNTFFKNGALSDAPDDDTVRPNVFLAYYLYPELLAKDDWEKCFDRILSELYLSWGGISSVSQADKKFICEDEGENCPAYHNGDSWYFLNNLAAAALYEINPTRYSRYINEIMEASTREILYMGAIGHHGEVSSAESQQSLGCGAQLWSSAMYLGFFDAVMKDKDG